MTQSYTYDLIVIGAGPGGYTAAIRASQLNMKTAVVEMDEPGGICLNWGCIPSKSLITQAGLFSSIRHLEELGVEVDIRGFDYAKVYQKSRRAAARLGKGVSFLLKKNNVDYFKGRAKITEKNRITINGKEELSAAKILIATGSRPRSIPGFSFDEKNILSSSDALSLQELPQSLLILGAGAIGVEFSYIFSSFGVQVHLVEMLDQILPLEDHEASEIIVRALQKKKIKIYTLTHAGVCQKEGRKYAVVLQNEKGETHVLVDKILIAAGREANTQDIGCENVGIKTIKGFIRVDKYGQTNIPDIYAAGDVVGGSLLAHTAACEGEAAAGHMAGLASSSFPDPLLIPGAVYCEPQIGSFGLTEKKAEAEGIKFEKVVFPFRALGKSVAMESTEGMIKVLYSPESKDILGVHIVGRDATELIHEMLLAAGSGLKPSDIADVVHAHPTFSEALKEVAAKIEGHAIHW